MAGAWNPDLYQGSHSFVWQYGRELLGLLEAQAGERILDVGCGTGQLTAEIAAAGAETVGIDNSQEMIAQARHNYPGLRFEVLDICDLEWRGEFDAVFSNAVLHWVARAGDAARAMAGALKPRGRLVAEFGGRGNVAAVLEAARGALAEIAGTDPGDINPWFYPGVAEYAAILERCGLEVTFATLFDRMTALEGGARGLADWCAMFGGRIAARVPAGRQAEFLAAMERLAAPALLRDGVWFADYRRLRITARKTI